eukprot:scaffold66941_cov17-Prasinocladus_malaysianus.AAC.1
MGAILANPSNVLHICIPYALHTNCRRTMKNRPFINDTYDSSSKPDSVNHPKALAPQAPRRCRCLQRHDPVIPTKPKQLCASSLGCKSFSFHVGEEWLRHVNWPEQAR